MTTVFIILGIILILIIDNRNNKARAALDNFTTEIPIEIRNQKGFENEIMPWVPIKNPEKFIADLIDKDKIVVKQNDAVLVIDYPLENPIEIEIKSEDSNGFKKSELIEIISREYKRIYQEEEDSAQIKTIPKNERKGVINRNKTNGKYGIWGHDIDDLVLSAIIVKKTKNGKIILELDVES